jgi:hypothetical protein
MRGGKSCSYRSAACFGTRHEALPVPPSSRPCSAVCWECCPRPMLGGEICCCFPLQVLSPNIRRGQLHLLGCNMWRGFKCAGRSCPCVCLFVRGPRGTNTGGRAQANTQGHSPLSHTVGPPAEAVTNNQALPNHPLALVLVLCGAACGRWSTPLHACSYVLALTRRGQIQANMGRWSTVPLPPHHTTPHRKPQPLKGVECAQW